MKLDPKYRWYTIKLKDEFLKPCSYTFRGLTTRELRISGTKETKYEAEHFILTQVVTEQKDWNTMPAGVCLKLLKEIYRLTGIDDEGLTFKEAMNWIQSETGSLEAAAIAMIPSCTPEVLENCDPFHYAKFLVMGKFQFETMYGIPVEQAFMGAPPSGGIDPNPKRGPEVRPGPGEVGYQVENQFEWHKGK